MMRLSPTQILLLSGGAVPDELEPVVDQIITERVATGAMTDPSLMNDGFEKNTIRYNIALEFGAWVTATRIEQGDI